MDTLTKQLIDRSAAYSSAFSEVFNKDTTINHADVSYVDEEDIGGKFVRAYHPTLGYSSKYYYGTF